MQPAAIAASAAAAAAKAEAGSASANASSSKEAGSSKDSGSSSSSFWGKLTKLTSSSKRVSDTGAATKKQQQQSAAAVAAAAAVEQLAQEQAQVLARSKARDWQGIAGMSLSQIQQLSVDDLMTVVARLPGPAGGSSNPAARDFARFELAMMWVEGDRQKRQHSRRMEDSLEMVQFAGFDKQQLWEARRFPAVDSNVFLRQRLLMAYQERMMQQRREEADG
jgi:hypothetical protein